MTQAASKIHGPREYELSEEDIESLRNAANTPVMMVGGVSFDAVEASNAVWQGLGNKYGFVWDTAKPIPGKHYRFFQATPRETESEREERVAAEKAALTAERIDKIKNTIAELQWELDGLTRAK